MRTLPLLLVSTLAGCMGATRAARLDPPTLSSQAQTLETTQTWPAWPQGYEPGAASVFVRNALFIPAPPERVYAWLARADRWSTWFSKISDVRIESGDARLAVGSKVSFHMLGAHIHIAVTEAEPGRRLAWEGGAKGVHAYHAWVLEPAPGGTLVLTEETEHGGVASFAAGYIRHALKDAHQRWLDGLAKMAASGEP